MDLSSKKKFRLDNFYEGASLKSGKNLFFFGNSNDLLLFICSVVFFFRLNLCVFTENIVPI